MTGNVDAAQVPHIERQQERTVEGILSVFEDLQNRAEIGSRLLRSAQGPRHKDGTVTVAFPADVWFAAVAADVMQRPDLPEPPPLLGQIDT